MSKKPKPRVHATIVTGWERAMKMSRRTVGKTYSGAPVSDRWKAKMLLAEHSPIRLVEYDISLDKVRQWVTVHLVRHWLGFIPFVHTQREDRRELDCDRDDLPQGSLNDMDVSTNAQALINISRRRLCMKASPETRECMNELRDAIREVDPVMADKMVRNCVYRGFCPEMESCGYVNSEAFKEELERYRDVSRYCPKAPVKKE